MAMALSLALLVGWTAVGLAVLNAGRFRGAVRKLLLAPAVGFAALAVASYLAVRAGFPVNQSGAPVALAVFGGAFAVLWLTRGSRVAAAARRFAPFAAVLAAAVLLTGWPLLRYGWDWVANGNDDMANYCVGAAGFQAHGYLRVPTPEELTAGQDYTQAMWFLYHDAGTMTQKRCGAELTLARVATCTGLTPQQAFMPVVVALNGALVAATAGLVLATTRRRAAALWAGGLLAVSSQTGYAVVQQLIAQAAGLSLLCVSVALVASPFRRFGRGVIVRRALACGLVFAGLVVFYPEAVPFLVGGCVLLGLRDVVRRRLCRRHLGHATAAIVAMAVLVPVYLYGTAYFLLGQANQGAGAAAHTLEIFPYFMTPRGAALALGLLPAASDVPEPRQSASMALGLLLLAAAVWVGLGQFRRGRPAAAVLLVMSALAAGLYAQKAAFGLFKIAMFAQPFLWATAAAWATSRRRRWAAVAAAGLLVAVGGLNAGTQYACVRQSIGRESFVDLPAVTQQHLLTEFHADAGARLARGDVSRVVVATENNVLVKLLAAELPGVPNTQLTMAPYHRYTTPEELAKKGARPSKDTPAVRAEAVMSLTRDLPAVRDPDTGAPLHHLLSLPADWTRDRPERVLVVAGRGPLSVLNRHRYPADGPALLCAPLSEVRNLAVFRDATGARQNFLGMDTVGEVALFRPELDPDYPGRTVVAVGRRLVLDVLNPTPAVRLLVDYTTTHRANPERGLPPTTVAGDRRVALGAVGVGSARLVSPPLAPQAVGPSHLLAIDFGDDPVRHANRLTGFEKLWGSELPRDRRLLTASARDVSVISEEEYAAFRPPAMVDTFPEGLLHPHLEYSGVFESGWVGKALKFRLTQPNPGDEVVLRGEIPQVPGGDANFRTELTVLVDGLPVETRTVGTGPFEVRAPGAGPGPRWVEYRFAHDQQLPAPDGRRLSARLRSVGFEPRDERKSRPPEVLASFPADLRHPKLEQSGVFADGWCGPAVQARLHAPAGSDAVIRGQIPGFGGPAVRTEVVMLLDGAEVARREFGPGDFELRAPAAGAAATRRLECRFSHVFALPPPDGRAVGAQLKAVGFEPGR